MSPIQRSSVSLFASLVLVAGLLGACSKAEEAAVTESTGSSATQPAAELPSEIADVAAALSPSSAPGTNGAATAAEGSVPLVLTGEFVSPMESALVMKQPGGVVTKIHVDIGDTIRRGQALLETDADYVRLAAERLEAEKARVEAGLAEAERDLARKAELLAKGSVPQALYDRSLANRDQLRAALDAANAGLAEARQREADCILRSPFDGVVAARLTDLGERLGENNVAFMVVQLRPLRLRVAMPERELGNVRRGQTVRALVEPFPGEEFVGTVKILGQALDPRSRTFTIEAEFPNQDGRLRPGLFARVELVGEGSSDA